jgi:hypothetical protein
VTDREILERLSLSEQEATDLCHKIVTLDPDQIRLLAGATTDRAQAAAAIGPGCSQEDLQRFIDARKGHHPASANNFFAPKEGC